MRMHTFYIVNEWKEHTFEFHVLNEERVPLPLLLPVHSTTTCALKLQFLSTKSEYHPRHWNINRCGTAACACIYENYILVFGVGRNKIRIFGANNFAMNSNRDHTRYITIIMHEISSGTTQCREITSQMKT